MIKTDRVILFPSSNRKCGRVPEVDPGYGAKIPTNLTQRP
jgi:hypothetical protein